MVFIINGKKYDTEKATKVIGYMQSYPAGELFGHTMYVKKETLLYRTEKGDYDKYTAHKIHEEEAKKILSELNAIDLYNKYFGELEEA